MEGKQLMGSNPLRQGVTLPQLPLPCRLREAFKTPSEAAFCGVS